MSVEDGLTLEEIEEEIADKVTALRLYVNGFIEENFNLEVFRELSADDLFDTRIGLYPESQKIGFEFYRDIRSLNFKDDAERKIDFESDRVSELVRELGIQAVDTATVNQIIEDLEDLKGQLSKYLVGNEEAGALLTRTQALRTRIDALPEIPIKYRFRTRQLSGGVISNFSALESYLSREKEASEEGIGTSSSDHEALYRIAAEGFPQTRSDLQQLLTASETAQIVNDASEARELLEKVEKFYEALDSLHQELKRARPNFKADFAELSSEEISELEQLLEKVKETDVYAAGLLTRPDYAVFRSLEGLSGDHSQETYAFAVLLVEEVGNAIRQYGPLVELWEKHKVDLLLPIKESEEVGNTIRQYELLVELREKCEKDLLPIKKLEESRSAKQNRDGGSYASISFGNDFPRGKEYGVVALHNRMQAELGVRPPVKGDHP